MFQANLFSFFINLQRFQWIEIDCLCIRYIYSILFLQYKQFCSCLDIIECSISLSPTEIEKITRFVCRYLEPFTALGMQNFVRVMLDKEAGKVVLALIQQGHNQLAASNLGITSPLAVLIEKRSNKRMLDKFTKISPRQKDIKISLSSREILVFWSSNAKAIAPLLSM